jgi:hypothetical protein
LTDDDDQIEHNNNTDDSHYDDDDKIIPIPIESEADESEEMEDSMVKMRDKTFLSK